MRRHSVMAGLVLVGSEVVPVLSTPGLLLLAVSLCWVAFRSLPARLRKPS